MFYACNCGLGMLVMFGIAQSAPSRLNYLQKLRSREKQMNAMKLAIPLLVALAYGPSQGLAVPILGSELASFAVLGASTVTNTGPTTFTGNLG